MAGSRKQTGAPRVVAVCAARNEGDRIGDTVRALRMVPAVAEVVVIDDGSRDATSAAAHEAGARVIRSATGVGKGGALQAAISRIDRVDVFLLVDGDAGASASKAGPLLGPVLGGDADLAVGVLPRPPVGGFGLVKRAAVALVRRATGTLVREPLSGQRAMTAECLRACLPLAGGFGVESGMVADALRLGFRVVEVPVEIEHRFTGRDLPGFVHRGRQGLEILRALAPRALGLR